MSGFIYTNCVFAQTVVSAHGDTAKNKGERKKIRVGRKRGAGYLESAEQVKTWVPLSITYSF